MTQVLINGEMTNMALWDGHNINISTFFNEVKSIISKSNIVGDEKQKDFLNTRIDKSENSEAGNLFQSDKFQKLKTIEECRIQFAKCLSTAPDSASTGPIINLADKFTDLPVFNTHQALKHASAFKNEFYECFKNSTWCTGEHKDQMSLENVANLFGYYQLLITLPQSEREQIRHETFSPTDTLTDLTMKIKKTAKTPSGFKQKSHTSFSIQKSKVQAANSSDRSTPTPNEHSRSNSPSRSQKYCNICKKTNHWTNSCYFNYENRSKDFSQNSRNAQSTWYYCSVHGHGNHSTKYCRRINKPYFCDNHGQGSHSTSYCLHNTSRPQSRNSQA